MVAAATACKPFLAVQEPEGKGITALDKAGPQSGQTFGSMTLARASREEKPGLASFSLQPVIAQPGHRA